MKAHGVDAGFPTGLLRPELFVGICSSVNARNIGANFSEAARASASQFEGGRYGRGEVGEFVLIEGQQNLILGRIAQVYLREAERRVLAKDVALSENLEALGTVELLGSVAMHTLEVAAGIAAYPRLGDRIYAAPHKFVALLPQLMEKDDDGSSPVYINLGSVDVAQESQVLLRPERLLGRHCAILGATGGGKSWTTARIMEECLRHSAKLILIDATGEYRSLDYQEVKHCHLGDPVHQAKGSTAVSLPPTSFIESDFVAMFDPSGKVQGPKMRAAIRSLRIAALRPDLFPDGYVPKINKPKALLKEAEEDASIAAKLDDPSQAFDVSLLPTQIEQECVHPDGFSSTQRGVRDTSIWGGEDGNFAHCLSLVARINGVLTSPAFKCVFKSSTLRSLTSLIHSFFTSEQKLLRICVSGIAYEYSAREIIANVIGRHILGLARSGDFTKKPTVLVVDEAHNFLGRRIGTEDHQARLDAFELIAKEGRKYGLTICLSSQRPRDITEGVLSQIGTLIVHRLTNDRDREVVERACGEIDKAASAFLPNLRPGEAALVGADFPIPLTIQVSEPEAKPMSDGPKYQQYWAVVHADENAEVAKGHPVQVSRAGRG